MASDDAVPVADAHKALAVLSKEERDLVLSLPPREAMTIIRCLIAWPGSKFIDPNTLVGP